MSNWRWWWEEGAVWVEAPFGGMCMYTQDMTLDETVECIPILIDKMFGMLDEIINDPINKELY